MHFRKSKKLMQQKLQIYYPRTPLVNDITIPLIMLKDSLSLAGKMSQSINQLRRKLIKPALPLKFSKLEEKSEESSESLFGDSVSESVENLEKKNKLKSLPGKRKYSEESLNSKFSSKTIFSIKRIRNMVQSQSQYLHYQPYYLR